ncbi:secretion protein EspJ [Mycobacterium shinjukuense]|uniref:Uncharacterized protein n=1 Tax=Mycobacterium shinjukuense TaxID=398694 RepID=A0A7I7MTE3_9MYCO|nr:hypothetical protein [Mycobacterium shinjukuense]MCV6986312.1 secretion protein EspJ [Mycobacterium shinjukuense]ORB62641.1 hypothetical protein BST45_18635 [Mycobacterium shinjukuense]BBX75190.1 hypothetical protein MSHI_30960 [Mycobacterium shinjukuense]
MAKELAVDPAGLSNAGIILGGLTFPSVPPPVTAAGTDAAAAAINATMPDIEAPAIERMSAVKAALIQTGSSIATAGAMYAELDQTLGDRFNQLEQLATQLGQLTTTPMEIASQLGQTANLPQLGETATQLGLPTAIEQISPIEASIVQCAQGAAQSPGETGAGPAQLTQDITSAGQPPVEQGQTVDATRPDDTSGNGDQPAPDPDAEAGHDDDQPGPRNSGDEPAQGDTNAPAGPIPAYLVGATGYPTPVVGAPSQMCGSD